MAESRPSLRPWHFVLAFGVVSLLADMVYEGARSIIGPYLAALGASATVVGLVAGAGEFIGYGLRVVSGYAVSRTQHYWVWTILGYALTVLSVPLIGVTGTLAPALLLYGSERLGKAVRAPAKDTLLSHASTATGRGKAFGVHQAMDQTGAILGPLVLAAVLSLHQGDYRLAFGILAVPGIAVLAVLFWLRARVPDPLAYEDGPVRGPATPDLTERLPARFWWYVGAVAVLSCGVASFPLLAYHATRAGLVGPALIPVLFAVAMGVDGLTGLVVGKVYDDRGPIVLLVVPLAAAASVLAFGLQVWMVCAGVAIWGMVNGVLDSTVKAVVTELVPAARRAVAFGWLALVRGLGLLVAGGVLGAVYDQGRIAAMVLVVAANLVALVALRRRVAATYLRNRSRSVPVVPHVIPRTLATLAAAMLLTGCEANPPQTQSGEQTQPASGATLSVTTADNVAVTRAESRRLLTVLDPPDGGKIVSTSPIRDLRQSQLGIGPSDPKFSEHAWWTVPMSSARFAAWLRDQHIAGMKGQDGGSSSVPSGAMMPYFEFDGEGTAAYVRPILNLGWLPYGDGVAVRLDTFIGARFARTVLVPTDTTSVAIRRTVTSFNPRRTRVRRSTVTDPARVRRLVAAANALDGAMTAPFVASCPAQFSQTTYLVTFAGPQGSYTIGGDDSNCWPTLTMRHDGSVVRPRLDPGRSWFSLLARGIDPAH